jgi:carbamate kinase
VLITGVDAVQLDFGKPTQRRLTWLDSAEAERHLADGHFPAGSMGPKVSAAVGFVERGSGRTSVITTPDLVVDTLASTDPADTAVGTRITSVGTPVVSPVASPMGTAVTPDTGEGALR